SPCLHRQPHDARRARWCNDTRSTIARDSRNPEMDHAGGRRNNPDRLYRYGVESGGENRRRVIRFRLRVKGPGADISAPYPRVPFLPIAARTASLIAITTSSSAAPESSR